MITRRVCAATCIVLTGFLLAGCGGGAAATPVETEATEPPPTATPPGLQATVMDVINRVDAHPLPDGEWERALVDMLIQQGGEVWAREASTARVDVEAERVRVAPNTIFTLDQPQPDTMQLTLEEGQIWLDVEGLEPGQTFEVETPGATASVRGTRFSVRAKEDGSTIVSTQVGTVTVAAQTQVVTATAGLQVEVPAGGPPENAQPMTFDEQVRWGMAVGADLDVVLPVVGDSAVVSATGALINTDWSPGGQYFAFSIYDPLQGKIGTAYYDTQTGALDSFPAVLGENEKMLGVFFGPEEGVFAYRANGAQSDRLCTSRMGGSEQTCFGGDAMYGWPLWSPDGEWLLFYSDRGLDGEGFGLYKARPDGSDFTPLTDGDGPYNIRQSWSPDGESIAFVRASDYQGPGDVWVMGADGSDARPVFEGIREGSHDHLAWSPDGSALVVAGQEGGLYLVSPDDKTIATVRGTDGWTCWMPEWSPTGDGWPIWFYSEGADGETPGLWTVSEQGGPTYFAATTLGPLFDSSHVAFARSRSSEESYETRLHFFNLEPSFWPASP